MFGLRKIDSFFTYFESINDAYKEMEGLLYAPGIADCFKGGFYFVWPKKRAFFRNFFWGTYLR